MNIGDKNSEGAKMGLIKQSGKYFLGSINCALNHVSLLENV